jgi:hypothetical protein
MYQDRTERWKGLTLTKPYESFPSLVKSATLAGLPSMDEPVESAVTMKGPAVLADAFQPG